MAERASANQPPSQPPTSRKISAQNSHVFNVPKTGRPRPEHHAAKASLQNRAPISLGAAQPTSGFINPKIRSNGVPSASNSQSSGQASNSSAPTATANGFDDDLFKPMDAWSSRGNRMAPAPAPAPAPSFSGGFAAANRQPVKGSTQSFAVSKPASAPVSDRPAASRPFFGSKASAFDPYNMPPSHHFIDLTQPQPRSRQAEVVILEDYMDQDEANEKLKNLLEGNLGGDDIDEDEDEENADVNDLADGLQKKLEIVENPKDVSPTPKPTEKQETPADDGARPGLKVKLLSHQIVGVKWMNQKECGKGRKKGSQPRGGILADDMGLGKTLQTIATIVTNPRPAKDSEEAKKQKIRGSTSKGTLIVVPLPLLQQWEGEIAKFVEASLNYKVHVHYGPKRQIQGKAIEKNDVVLTTYETLVSDFGNSKFDTEGQRVACFDVDWYRVVLDEAHRIKNPATKQSKACCALKSHYRWCLTGTPMQNKLDEIQSLIRFLKIEPYDNMRHWKDQITNPMNRGKGGVAMRRVQILLKAILLRRTKDFLREKGELQTVGRKVKEVAVGFSPSEKRIYDNLEERMASTIDRMGSKLNYANALVLLLRLRQACNHPELVKASLGQDKDALMTGSNTAPSSPVKGSSAGKAMDQLADVFGTLDMGEWNKGGKSCSICGTQMKDSKLSTCSDCQADLGGLDSTESSPIQTKDARRKLVRDRKKQRNVHNEFDSDEDDEDTEGDWLVPEDQRGSLNLGRAGGSDDEDAEGGGESLGEDDSETDDEDEDDVVSGNRVRRKANRAIALDSSDEEDERNDLGNNSESSDEDDDAVIPGVRGKSRVKGRSSKSEAGGLFISAKIRELMNILRRESKSHKTIVFSSFVSMLRLIEPFLIEANMGYTHYNGQMRNDLREASLDSLRNDANTRVLLCSLKSGALGLNLTAASRVVIIEPFWNPFVEEQAIDRVHRIGQKHDVVVYKLTIAETVEQRIVALQERKRQLAKMALESGQSKVAGAGALTMKQVLALFRRDAEQAGHGHDDDDDNVEERRGGLLRKT